ADPEVEKSYQELGEFVGTRVISALYGKGVEQLIRDLVARMPEGPAFYDPEEVTDQTVRALSGELIREQVLRLTSEEIPHSVAVRIDQFEERESGPTYIHATVFVERDSQKGILIGHKGEMLKQIGTQAREAITKMLDSKVYLELHVKVLPNWRKEASALKRLGYIVD
ncbi:MAG: GTPase Era, partial [Candidatus Sericytochromatia bacterium]